MRGFENLGRRNVVIQKGAEIIETVGRCVYIRWGTNDASIWYEKMFRPVVLLRGRWYCIIREGLHRHD